MAATAQRFKLVFFSPTKNTSEILNHLFTAYPRNVGRIGEYERCAFIAKGIGQFRPLPGAHPTVGSAGQQEIERVEEDRVEVLVCDDRENVEIQAVIKELKKVHPYEEVAYDVYRLEDI